MPKGVVFSVLIFCVEHRTCVCRGGLARGGSGVGAASSHAEKAVGVGGKSGAKWRNQSNQLRIAMSASQGGPQVTHPADNASLLTNAVCHA